MISNRVNENIEDDRGNKFKRMILFGRKKYLCIGKQWCHQYLKSYVSVRISKLYSSSETFLCLYKLTNTKWKKSRHLTLCPKFILPLILNLKCSTYTVFLHIFAPSSQVQSLIYVEIGDTSLTGQTKICLRPFRSSLNSYK